MTVMLLIFCYPVGLISLTAIILGVAVLGLIAKQAENYSSVMQEAQEQLVTHAIEYIRGISVLRSFKKGKEVVKEVGEEGEITTTKTYEVNPETGKLTNSTEKTETTIETIMNLTVTF